MKYYNIMRSIIAQTIEFMSFLLSSLYILLEFLALKSLNLVI